MPQILKKIIMVGLIVLIPVIGMSLFFLNQKTTEGFVEKYLVSMFDPWSASGELTVRLQEFHWGGLWYPLSFKADRLEVNGLKSDLQIRAETISLKIKLSQLLLGRVVFSSFNADRLILSHQNSPLVDVKASLTPSWQGDHILISGTGHDLEMLGQVLTLPFLQAPKIGEISFEADFIARERTIIGKEIRLTRNNTQLQSSFQMTSSSPWQDLWLEGGQFNIKVTGQASSISVNDLSTFWPEGLAPKPRQWVIQNLHEGQVELATLNMTGQVNLLQQGQIETFKIEELNGDIKAKGITVHYLDPMPPVTGASGTCQYDEKQFVIKASGEVNAIQLHQGHVIISGLDQNDQFITIELENDGPIDKCLGLLKSKPLELTHELGLHGLNIHGHAQVQTKLEFPLRMGLPLEMIEVSAKAHLAKSQVQSTTGVFNYLPLQDGKFDLSVTKKNFHLEGHAKLGQWPSEVSWDQYFLPDDAPYQQRLQIKMKAEWPIVNEWGGKIPIDGWYEAQFSGKSRGYLKASFDHFALSLPWLSWSKKEGHGGEGIIEWAFNKGKGTINRLDITGPNIDIRAKGDLDSQYLKQLQFSVFRVGNLSPQVVVKQNRRDFYQVNMTLKQFDMSQLINEIDLLTQSTGDFSLPFEVGFNMIIDRLIASKTLTLANMRADIRWSRDRLGLIDIKAKHTSDNSSFVFRLTPTHNNGSQEFNLQTGQAGEFLELFGTGYDMQGGKMSIVGHKKSSQDTWSCDGEAHLENITVRQAPVLAHLLSLASLQGIIHMFTGQGIHFRYGHGFFKLSPSQLQFNKSELSGSALGIFFEGSLNRLTQHVDFHGELIPIYGVNQLLANVPILGHALSGGNQEGIFRTSFTISGSKEAPQVKVNPLTTLTPGGVRAALEAGRRAMKKAPPPGEQPSTP